MKNVSREGLRIRNQFGFWEGLLSLFSFRDNVYPYHFMKKRVKNEELTVDIGKQTAQELHETWKQVGDCIRYGMDAVEQERQESHGQEEANS